MRHRAPSFFDRETQLSKIYELNGFLPKLKSLADFEIFRDDLQQVREKERQSNAGRKPFDVVLMFKILILKSLYNLSDDRIEEQIRDRLSFHDFLDLQDSDLVPDAKTIWLFAEDLKNHGLEQDLFDRFHEELERQGFSAKSGIIVDGSFVEVPRQRNTKEENAQIKNGEIPESLSSNPHVLCQKDTDAEWTKKGEETHFGYKDHVAIDDEYKLIRGYGVTGAATHDSEPYLDLMPKEPTYPDQEAFADSAYKSKEIDEKLTGRGFVSEIHEKGYRNNPLTEVQKESNKVKSSVRCRVEHVFGEMKMRMGNEVLRTIGFGRARFWIGMRNLVYNMSRLVSLKCPKKLPNVAK
jgi:IS5 family transposase